MLLPERVEAVCIDQHAQNLIVVAGKGKREFKYITGAFVKIQYGRRSEKIRGRILIIRADSILVETNTTTNETLPIAINEIESIMEIHKADRKGWATMLGLIMLFAVLGAYVLDAKSFFGTVGLTIATISLYSFIPYLIFSFLTDVFSRKSTKKGWVFRSKPAKS